MTAGPVFLALVALAVGCVNLFLPQAVFFLREGWKFRDAKPSELFLLLTQISGMVFIAIGALVLIFGLLLG